MTIQHHFIWCFSSNNITLRQNTLHVTFFWQAIVTQGIIKWRNTIKHCLSNLTFTVEIAETWLSIYRSKKWMHLQTPNNSSSRSWRHIVIPSSAVLSCQNFLLLLDRNITLIYLQNRWRVFIRIDNIWINRRLFSLVSGTIISSAFIKYLDKFTLFFGYTCDYTF